MSDITVWKKASTQVDKRRKKSGKKESSGCGALFVFAILLSLSLVGVTFFVSFMFPDNDDAIYLAMFCLIALIIGACLLFVRANMSDFIVFIKEEGVLYRAMFTNSEAGASLYGRLDKDLGGREEAIKKAKSVSGITRVASDSSTQLCKIIEVKKIREYKSNFRVRCVVAQVIKKNRKLVEKNNKAKTLRVIKNYEDMDCLIEEFKALK